MVVAVASLVLADQTALHLGIAPAAGLLRLVNLATLVICARQGWRQVLLATVLMALTAFGLGLIARWQLQQLYDLMIISFCD